MKISDLGIAALGSPPTTYPPPLPPPHLSHRSIMTFILGPYSPVPFEKAQKYAVEIS